MSSHFAMRASCPLNFLILADRRQRLPEQPHPSNDLLVKSEWQSASLREILEHEFSPYDLSRFQLRGGNVDCPYAVAVLLALIVHELTTNAVKYGALSIPSG